MDINSLLKTQSLLAPNKGLENTFNLQVGQQLDVKTIKEVVTAAKNSITLSLGNKDITVQSNQPITLRPGQDLKIQVTQVAPVIEFKIVSPLPQLTPQTTDLRFKLIATARDGGGVEINREQIRTISKEGGNMELMQPTSKNGGNVQTDRGMLRPTSAVEIGKEPSLMPQINQALDTKIIGISGNKIQMQIESNPLAATSSAETGNKQAVLITVERSQLTNAPSDLRVGQNLSLEVIKAGATPEFKIITTSSTIPEAKIAEFIKQFLPRHEAAPIFLNQLIKDLPQLMENKTVPQTLKDIAAQIIQNLPPKEQLISSQGLKQALANSGLFLEGKLPAQAELINALPLLMKNESLPLSLQRIASEILRNLTQKEPLPDQAKALSIDDVTAQKLNLDEQTDTVKTGAFGTEDFKANLLKFIGALKQELNAQPNQVDIDLLKNLHTKTENTVAKIVLDQLMSLPKDDNPKQIWVIDIPFLNRQQAESVRIEVQKDKENKHHADSNDWSVNITITPPVLGTIHCMVSSRKGVINTFFKSPILQTTDLIKHNLDYLKNQLEEAGLKTGHMDAHDSAQKTQLTHQPAGKPLFDDKA